MKSLRYLLLTLIAAIGLILPSCIHDDLSTSPSDVLAFSRDTVSFDTVFTELGTPTARLLVFNRSGKGINISSIRFKDPQSNFTLNVDGMSGREFHDVEIRRKDSIYVFIECFIDSTEGSEPFLREDKLEFVTNGVIQQVQVEAYGQNVTRLRNVTFKNDTRLTAERPYVVFDSLVVDAGATLTIEPGTRLLFHDGAGMIVRGRLEALGEPGREVHLRGDRLDNVLPDVAYDILSGQWKGITIRPESFGNILTGVDMRSTEYGLRLDSCELSQRTKLTVLNSWLHNSKKHVMEANGARIDVLGSCLSDAGEAVLSMTGGVGRFLQSTFANYYLYAFSPEAIVSLYHLFPVDLETSSQPLLSATFENCILYGMTPPLTPGNLKDSDVFFRCTLIGADGSDDDNFISCIWNEDPLFYTVREDYIFNYRLRSDSPAIGKGNPSYVTQEVMYDMDGLNRLSGGAPDIGAYVFVPTLSE